MTRISRVEMEWLCREISDHAKALNLLPANAQITWVPGSKGIAPSTPVAVPQPDGSTTALHTSFLPDFGYRDTTRDAFRALTATNKVLSVLAARER